MDTKTLTLIHDLAVALSLELDELEGYSIKGYSAACNIETLACLDDLISAINKEEDKG